MSASKSFGLSLKKPTTSSASDPQKSKIVAKSASVFDEDSDDEDMKKASASDRFDHKYGSLKARDHREQQKVLAEDPTAYEYDAVYEEAQKLKNEKTEQQRKADVEKKPKYADKIINAHKKRELEKLLHDENTYKKEREKEAGEFEDKDAFVTGAYKEQIIERNKFRKEIEERDAIDALTNVKDQNLWQQAFNRKLLDDRARTSQLEPKEENAMEVDEEQVEKVVEVKVEVTEKTTMPVQAKKVPSTSSKLIKPSIYSSDEEEEEHQKEKEKTPPKRFEELKPGLNIPKLKTDSNASRTISARDKHDEKEDRFGNGQENPYKYVRERTSPNRNGKQENTGNDGRDQKPLLKPVKEETRDEIATRMVKIREILKRRNTDEDIEEAKKRYFERVAEGTVTIPV